MREFNKRIFKWSKRKQTHLAESAREAVLWIFPKFLSAHRVPEGCFAPFCYVYFFFILDTPRTNPFLNNPGMLCVKKKYKFSQSNLFAIDVLLLLLCIDIFTYIHHIYATDWLIFVFLFFGALWGGRDGRDWEGGRKFQMKPINVFTSFKDHLYRSREVLVSAKKNIYYCRRGWVNVQMIQYNEIVLEF